jgi:hypothetical protein
MSYIFTILVSLKVSLLRVLFEPLRAFIFAFLLQTRLFVRVNVVSRRDTCFRTPVFDLFVRKQIVVSRLVHVRGDLSRPRAQLFRSEIFEFFLHRFAVDNVGCAPPPERRGHEFFGLRVCDGVGPFAGHAFDLFEDLGTAQLFAPDGDSPFDPTLEPTGSVLLRLEFSVKTQRLGLARSKADHLANLESIVVSGSGLIDGVGDDLPGHVKLIGDASVRVPALDAVFAQDVSLEHEISPGEIFVLPSAPRFVLVGVSILIGVQDGSATIVKPRSYHM